MKKNTILYIIITILLIVIAVGVTYIIMDNNNKTETKEEENNNNENNEQENIETPTIEDGITLKNTIINNDTIIQKYEAVLNGKVNNITITYTYENFIDFSDTHAITGMFNNREIIRNCYVNTLGKNYTKENTFNVSNINNIFDEKNFNIIKGTDNKSYLLVQTVNEMTGNFNTSELYLYNDELELISRNIISAEESPDYTSHDGFIIDNFIGNIPCDYVNNTPLYKRTFKIVDDTTVENGQYTKIENNKIYFLFPKLNENLDGGILEERIYTINNNKLEYTVNATYQFNSVCQQI